MEQSPMESDVQPPGGSWWVEICTNCNQTASYLPDRGEPCAGGNHRPTVWVEVIRKPGGGIEKATP